MPISRRISDRLSQNSRQQDRVIQQRQEKPSVRPAIARGERDRDTGLYDVADPRGGEDKPAIKANNARLDSGDLVRFNDDGVRLVIDGPNAGDDPGEIGAKGLVRNPDSLEGRVDRFFNCRGYINGQIFNCPGEDPTPTGLVILCHDLWMEESVTVGVDGAVYGDTNKFALEIFRYFTGGRGTIFFYSDPPAIPAFIDGNPEFSNYTITSGLITDAPAGSIFISPPIASPLTEDETTALLNLARAGLVVIYSINEESINNGGADTMNTILTNLGLQDFVQASPKLEIAGTETRCRPDISDPLVTPYNETVGEYTAIFRTFSGAGYTPTPVSYAMHPSRDNVVYDRNRWFVSGAASTIVPYTLGQITRFSVWDDIVGPLDGPNVNPLSGFYPKYSFDILDETWLYYPLTSMYSSLAVEVDGVCQPYYLSGIYVPPESLPS